MKAHVDGRKRVSTRNLVPGRAVYGETLFDREGVEHRAWNPHRSKLAAYLVQGGSANEFPDHTVFLYLGAGQGTTASHVSDLVPDGLVVCVEKSPRAAIRLLHAIGPRYNAVPVVADARRPDKYQRLVAGDVDVLYQDVAQSDQVDIFLRTAAMYGPRLGILAIKARSIAVERPPHEVFEEARDAIEDAGHEVVELIDLGRFQRDHAMLTVRFDGGAGGAT